MQEENTRESIEVDVLIIGAGPAGLATAIKLKTEANKNNQEINIVVLEKGSEVGAHILSGAVIDPIGLDMLLPNWRDLDPPAMSEVIDDCLLYTSPSPRDRLLSRMPSSA